MSLEGAMDLRLQRAKLCLAISAGDVRASRVLADFPPGIHGCGAFQFLTSLPSNGANGAKVASRAFILLRRAKAPGHKRLDELTEAKRALLVEVLRDYEDARHPSERGLT